MGGANGHHVCTNSGVPLDRKRQHFDIMERVLGTAHDDEVEPRPDVVEVGVRPGIIGTTSVVETTVLRHDEDDRRGGPSGPTRAR